MPNKHCRLVHNLIRDCFPIPITSSTMHGVSRSFCLPAAPLAPLFIHQQKVYSLTKYHSDSTKPHRDYRTICVQTKRRHVFCACNVYALYEVSKIFVDAPSLYIRFVSITIVDVDLSKMKLKLYITHTEWQQRRICVRGHPETLLISMILAKGCAL